MLTLSGFKYDLGIEQSDRSKDTQLKNFISRAKEILNGACNRKLISADYEEYLEINSIHYAFVNNYPINEITDIQKLQDDGITYESIFTSPDSASNSIVYNDYGKIELRNGYSFDYEGNQQLRVNVFSNHPRSLKYKILYNGGYIFETLTGTCSVTAGSVTVTGTSTLFLTQLAVGDSIIVGEQTRIVSTIATNTSLTVTEAFESTGSAQVITLSNVPEDLRNACLYIAMDLYSKSPIGDGRFGLSSNNTGGQSNTGQTFNNGLNSIEGIIADYRRVNI